MATRGRGTNKAFSRKRSKFSQATGARVEREAAHAFSRRRALTAAVSAEKGQVSVCLSKRRMEEERRNNKTEARQQERIAGKNNEQCYKGT